MDVVDNRDHDDAPRRGRPSIVPGEPSVQLRVSIEVSLYRQLRQHAQRQRAELNEAIREVLRDFVYEKLTPQAPRP